MPVEKAALSAGVPMVFFNGRGGKRGWRARSGHWGDAREAVGWCGMLRYRGGL
jgi:hypothetical protein